MIWLGDRVHILIFHLVYGPTGQTRGLFSSERLAREHAEAQFPPGASYLVQCWTLDRPLDGPTNIVAVTPQRTA